MGTFISGIISGILLLVMGGFLLFIAFVLAISFHGLLLMGWDQIIVFLEQHLFIERQRAFRLLFDQDSYYHNGSYFVYCRSWGDNHYTGINHASSMRYTYFVDEGIELKSRKEARDEARRIELEEKVKAFNSRDYDAYLQRITDAWDAMPFWRKNMGYAWWYCLKVADDYDEALRICRFHRWDKLYPRIMADPAHPSHVVETFRVEWKALWDQDKAECWYEWLSERSPLAFEQEFEGKAPWFDRYRRISPAYRL